MLQDKRRALLWLAVCLLLIVGVAGCVRTKPEREREPLPTVEVEAVLVDLDVVAEAVIDAEVDIDAEGDTEELAPPEGPDAVDVDDETPSVETEEPEDVEAPVEQAPTATPEPTATPVPYTGPLYVVAPGDTLSTIAAMHGSTVQAFMDANSLSNSAAIAPGQELRLPEGVAQLYDLDVETTTYVVRYGDTLNQIAALHRMPVGQLLALNPTLRNPNLLRPGAELTVAVNPIPEGAVVHVVQPGQTLATIASQYGVSMFDLADINFLTDTNRLDVGQELVIPQ